MSCAKCGTMSDEQIESCLNARQLADYHRLIELMEEDQLHPDMSTWFAVQLAYLRFQ